MDPILRADKISFSYQPNQAILKDISFSLEKGESLGVIGPNGGGKSTLMKIIAGILKPTSGDIYFAGIPARQFKTYPYHFFSYVPQTSELNQSLPVKVYEFLDFTFSLHKNKPELKLDGTTIDRLLDLVGIAHKKNEHISELSGGEKQRVLIARALIQKPMLLLLDEPTKGLDSNGQDQLLGLLEKIKNQDKTAIVIVDHNINQIIRSCRKILCLNRTFHWHDHRDFLTKNVLENIYHCEFEHLLIHDKDEGRAHDHEFCDHDHSNSKELSHPFLRRRE